MHAIMLAAGVGNRLEGLIDTPKCLLEIDGLSLLARHIEALAALNIEQLSICVGYRAEMIRAATSTAQLPIEYVLNDAYTEGSVISLWCMRDLLRSGKETIVMDADVLYAPEILKRLVESAHADCFLLDQDFAPGEEPVKLCVQNGTLVEFRKRLDTSLRYDLIGESVGFFKFSAKTSAALADRCADYVAKNLRDQPCEEAIRDLLLENPSIFGFEDVTGLPWIEIDYPEDIEAAKTQVLQKINDH